MALFEFLDFFMNRHLAATAAELLDFHLVRMGSLVASSKIVMFAAFAASEDDFIAFTGCHI